LFFLFGNTSNPRTSAYCKPFVSGESSLTLVHSFAFQDSEDESGECVLKGKSTSLSQFFRVARNLMSMVFKNEEPEVGDVEAEFWRLVIDRDTHMQVSLGICPNICREIG
jgi:hypothetical protein